MVLFQRRSSFRKKPKFKDCGVIIRNPFQGWYRIYLFDLQQGFDPEETKWCLHQEENLCLVEFDLGAYAKGALPAEALERLQQILTFFDSHEKQVILRFAYDFEGKAMEKEPTEVDIIQGHMEQVADVVRTFYPMILCIQGLFIGSWGEMHSSRYATESTLDGLYEQFRRCFGREVCLAVRRLSFLERWKGADENLTLFDDGMFGSVSDLGTFGNQRAEGIAAVARYTTNLPVGGEVLGEQLSTGAFSNEEIRDTMQKMHVSYLNCTYDEVGLSYLEKQKLLDEISKQMGYRLWIRDVLVDGEGLHITITNGGYGSYNLPGRLQLQNGCGDVYGEAKLPCIPSGEERVVILALPQESQKLYVSASVQNRYPLMLANGVEDVMYIGELHV